MSLADLAGTIRASYYGEEVMRLQRGRHEVKLMVRYPRDERRSFATLDEIRVAGPDGVKRPISELADVTVARGYSEINRLGQKRSITITADIDIANLGDSDPGESAFAKIPTRGGILVIRKDGQILNAPANPDSAWLPR